MHGDQRVFQFKIIINVSVGSTKEAFQSEDLNASLEYLCYGPAVIINILLFQCGIDIRCQILMSTDSRLSNQRKADFFFNNPPPLDRL